MKSASAAVLCLARQYATVEAPLAQPERQVFVARVKTRLEGFFVRSSKSARALAPQ